MPKYTKITKGKNKGKYRSVSSGTVRSKSQIAAIAISKKNRRGKRK